MANAGAVARGNQLSENSLNERAALLARDEHLKR